MKNESALVAIINHELKRGSMLRSIRNNGSAVVFILGSEDTRNLFDEKRTYETYLEVRFSKDTKPHQFTYYPADVEE